MDVSRTITSPGGSFTYEVIGAVCRLYDREQMPYPSCSLQWRGKQPSWNRVGRRFVPDIATKRSPSYNVRLEGRSDPFIYTPAFLRLDEAQHYWWYTVTKKAQNYVSEINIHDGFTEQIHYTVPPRKASLSR